MSITGGVLQASGAKGIKGSVKRQRAPRTESIKGCGRIGSGEGDGELRASWEECRRGRNCRRGRGRREGNIIIVIEGVERSEAVEVVEEG